MTYHVVYVFFFFQAEDGIRDVAVTGVQTCALPILLGIIENAGGDIEKAAEAERRIIEELRQMGNEVLHGWARRQQEKKEQEYNAKPGVNRKEKKNLYWHTRLGKIEIAEEVFTQGRGGPEIRPFCASAEVQCRGYSEGLQRAMTDFGAENAFAGAAAKLKRSEEHTSELQSRLHLGCRLLLEKKKQII